MYLTQRKIFRRQSKNDRVGLDITRVPHPAEVLQVVIVNLVVATIECYSRRVHLRSSMG